MGSVGDSCDNALMENFWSTLKIELVYRTSWRTRDEAENAIFEYIDTWYKTPRIQRGGRHTNPKTQSTNTPPRRTPPAASNASSATSARTSTRSPGTPRPSQI